MSTTTKRVEFDSKGVKLVGTLFLPAGFNASTPYKAVVMTPPAHQIKEQTLAVYGPKLAAKGFVAFAFDYNTKGESASYDAKVRNDENVPRKWEDLRNAISFLCAQAFVDKARLYALGVCAGGNIASSVLITDLRVKKLASVSAMMATDFMFADKEAFKGMVIAANESRQKAYSGEVDTTCLFGYDDADYVKKNPDASPEQLEGFHYYGKAGRAGEERYPRFNNTVLGSIWETSLLNLGEHYADRLMQPYMGVVGSKAQTAISTKTFFDKVTSEKEYVEIAGATHVDLYDNDGYVQQAVDKVSAFFDKKN